MVLTFALPQPQTGLAVLERPSFSMPRPAPPRATRGSVRDVWGQHVKDVLGLNTKGARVFNVKIQGATTFSNLDIFAEAGANAALVKGADVSNGQVSIEFDNIVQTAKVNAIEILPGMSEPSLMLNFKYPDGTPVAGTLAYTVSSSLLSFQGSAVLNNGQAQSVIFSNPSAMSISARFTVNLSLTDTAGHVIWHLNVGMNPVQVNIGAVQSSALNVVVQKM